MGIMVLITVPARPTRSIFQLAEICCIKEFLFGSIINYLKIEVEVAKQRKGKS
jgi:hypothetical protein